MRTAVASAKWMRMLRCVRRTWITPSNAQLRLWRTAGVRRTLMRREFAPAAPSPPRGRSRAGGAVRGRGARARPPRRPGGRARRPRAGAARRRGARRGRRSGTRGRGGRAPRRRPRRRRRRFGWRSRPGSPAALRARLLGVALVRLDDALDEHVAHDVLVAELDELDPVDLRQDAPHVDETGGLVLREVDLRYVTRDDHLRAEAQPGQEHLHLLRRRVLRLVQDDEGVVERPPPHERERRDLDRAPLHVRGQAVGVEHVVERVEQRTEVGVDLREHVPRKEAEALSRLDRGPREDDPAHLAVGERRDGQRHREVRLAGAGRSDAEGDRSRPDGVDVALLVDRLGCDLLAAVAPDDVLEHLARILGGVERGEDRVDGARPDRVAAFHELDELVHHQARRVDLAVVTLEGELVAAETDGAPHSVAQSAKDPVVDGGQLRCDLVGDREDLLQRSKSSGRSRPSRARAYARATPGPAYASPPGRAAAPAPGRRRGGPQAAHERPASAGVPQVGSYHANAHARHPECGRKRNGATAFERAGLSPSAPGPQASFSRTSWLTAEPSARPATCGMTSAITRPRAPSDVAPVSAIASSTIRSSSFSPSGSGMNSSMTSSSSSSFSACSSRPPERNASAASARRLRSRWSTWSSSSSFSSRPSSFSAA